jgi:hypothetical protein
MTLGDLLKEEEMRYELSSTGGIKSRLNFARYISGGLWGGLIIAIAIIAFLPKEFWHLRWIFFPMSMVVCVIISYLYKPAGYIKSLYKELTIGDSSNITLTVMYFNYLKFRYVRIFIYLLILSIIYSVITVYYINNQSIATVDLSAMILASLLLLRLDCIQKRILSGLFGTNAEEAKELIAFILAHSEDVDFTDGNGNLRKGFLPEEIAALELLPPGQEVRL